MHFLRQNHFWYLMFGALSHSLIETLIWEAGFPLPTCLANVTCAGAQGFAVHLVKNTSHCLCHITVAQLLKEDAVTSVGKAGRNKKWNIFLKKPKPDGEVLPLLQVMPSCKQVLPWAKWFMYSCLLTPFTGGRSHSMRIITQGRTYSVAQKCL